MAGANGSNDLHVQVVNRRLVKASDSSIKPHVLAVSNLDLIPQSMPVSMFCIYLSPLTGDFHTIITTFETGLPSLLYHFFPFAGRIATNPSSDLPEFHCDNQGAELLVGEADVALASLDYATVTASVRRVQQPYANDVALSVQLVSFACGGFAVAWCTNHVLVDGKSLSLLVSAWSELARTGTLAAGARPNHDRSTFRPRATPSYCASLNKAFTPVDAELQVNVLTAEQSVVERLYYIEASDIARLREAASSFGLPLEGPRRRCGRGRQALPHGVVGGRVTAAREAGSGAPRRHAKLHRQCHHFRHQGGDCGRGPEDGVAERSCHCARGDHGAGVRRAHFQELLVDWVEHHKTRRYIETASLGLGSPTVSVSAFTTFPLDTDFGFGSAAMEVPTATSTVRLCGGFVQVAELPKADSNRRGKSNFASS
ncbi:unnamed protein product [Urochloa humidicola]